MTIDRRNFLPSDQHRLAIDDLFEESKLWLTGEPLKTEGEVEGVEKLLKLAREAKDAADADRDKEKRPHDLASKAVQARYRPILDRADSIITAAKGALTVWRDAVTAKQVLEAQLQREVAERARAEAERVADVAKGSIEAEAVAKGAAEIAERFEKQATKLEKNAGRGLRMRTVRSGEIVDLKEVIAHFYRAERKWMQQTMQTRVDAELKRSSTPIPGVTISTSREAF